LATDVKALSGVVEIKCDELPKPHYKALEAMALVLKLQNRGNRRYAIC
jgi:hypothetical protein